MGVHTCQHSHDLALSDTVHLTADSALSDDTTFRGSWVRHSTSGAKNLTGRQLHVQMATNISTALIYNEPLS